MIEKEKGFWHRTKEVTENIWDGTKEITEDMWEGTKNVAGNMKDAFTGDDKAELAEKEHCSACCAEKNTTAHTNHNMKKNHKSNLRY